MFNKKGFTLIELLVVIGVLAVLMAGVVALINPLEKTRQANDAKIQSDISQISTAHNSFAAQQNDGTYACQTTGAACTQQGGAGGQSGTAAVGPAGTDELSVIPAVAPGSTGYVYQSNPATGRPVTDYVVYSNLTSSKYIQQCVGNASGTTPFFVYSSVVGRACIMCGDLAGYASYAAATADFDACDFL